MRRLLSVMWVLGFIILVACVVVANIWGEFYTQTAGASITALYVVLGVASFIAKN